VTSGHRRLHHGVLRVLLEPAPAILLAAALVHAVRRNAFDLAVFLGTVCVIVFDTAWRRPDRGAVLPVPPRAEPHRAGRRWAVTATVAVVGAVVGSMPLGSRPVRIALALLGLLALIVVATARTSAPSAEASGPNHRGWALWAGTLLLTALLELANFLAQPDPQTDSFRHPTLSALIGPQLGSRPVRMVVVACWLLGLVWIARACRTAAAANTPTGASESGR
jgi:hypothetical protein